MRTRKIYYFFVAFLALNISIVACSGDEGDNGIDGLKGEQGVQGEVGPAGADGSIIYSGEGIPASETGIEGDYYCDISTGMLYGPKTENASWEGSDSFSLKGEDGTNGIDGTDGTNGSSVISGNGEPTVDDGNWGDYYLDKETYTLYGPKSQRGAVLNDDSGWGLGLMLKGADGNANVHTFALTIGVNDWTATDNIASTFTKSLKSEKSFDALDQDMFENGIVLVYQTGQYSANQANYEFLHQLPITELTTLKNVKQTYFTVLWKDTQGGTTYLLNIEQELNCFAGDETLTKTNQYYIIKLITGETAVQLKANKDNQVEFNRLVSELAE